MQDIIYLLVENQVLYFLGAIYALYGIFGIIIYFSSKGNAAAIKQLKRGMVFGIIFLLGITIFLITRTLIW